MRLTQYTDYALRLMMMVSARTPKLVTVADAAEAYGRSRHHLTKIAHDLGKAGYLVTSRGRGGGLALGVDPKSIRLGQFAAYCEGTSAIVECFDRSTNRCVVTPVCGLIHMLSAAEAAFYRELDRYTLQDLVGDRESLLGVLFPQKTRT